MHFHGSLKTRNALKLDRRMNEALSVSKWSKCLYGNHWMMAEDSKLDVY